MKGGGSEGGLLALVVIIAVIAYAIMYIAIAAGACLAAYVLFLLVRMLYVGWIKSPKADPLFSKAAKTIGSVSSTVSGAGPSDSLDMQI